MYRRGKKKFINLKNIIIISFILLVNIFIAFTVNFKEMHDLILEKDIEQAEVTSGFITKLINTEIKNKEIVLKESQESLVKYIKDNGYSEDNIINYLDDVKNKFKFEKVGVLQLDGKCIDSRGEKKRVKNYEKIITIKPGERYISNVLDEDDVMIIAVPIIEDSKVVGAIWGHYAIQEIAKKIELSKDSPRYFQIIDDQGNYISKSNNVHTFTNEINIWDELKKYKLGKNLEIDDIKKNIKYGRSGNFQFSYNGEGRYVTYEQLGINNWYVFSVLVEDYLVAYVEEIEEFFSYLLWFVIISIIIVISIIGKYILDILSETNKKNEELNSKNSLLFMVMKHTNDIPFEVDLLKRSITLYRRKDKNMLITYDIDLYNPDNAIKKGIIEKEDYEDYKYIYEGILNSREIDSIVFKIKIDGKWDYNRIHIKTINKSQIIGFLEDYNEQILQSKKIKEISVKNRTDSLTNLYNREYFSEEVDRLIKEKQLSKTNKLSALFILDLDNFKVANDTLGHVIGDEILKESASIMKSVIRNTDLAGRLGGDEFVIFIQDAKDISAVRKFAEKINNALKRTYYRDGKKVDISVSIGISILNNQNSFNELYKLADDSLYRTKESGKDGYFL